MASLIPGEKIKGRVSRRIEFDALRGRRRQRVFIGRATIREGREFCQRLEQVLTDLRLGRSHEKHLCDWLLGLPATMQKKLHAKGLLHDTAARSTTLHGFLAEHFATLRLKPETLLMYGHTRRNLETFFLADRLIATIGSDDAERFRSYLLAHKLKNGRSLARATVAERVNMARQFFRASCRLKLISLNPFADVKGGSQRNPARLENVTVEAVSRVLAVCPTTDWKLLILLARYCGLRVPSEARLLKWEHVDFDAGTILVHCLKTEHHVGHEKRLVPIFDAVRPMLLEAFNGRSGPFVIENPKLRSARNLRTQLVRFIKRAGVEPWGKPWQNMRSTRESELMRQSGIKDACTIIGNSERVAMAHYAQVRPDFVTAAIRADRQAQNQARQPAATIEFERNQAGGVPAIIAELPGKVSPIPFDAGTGADSQWERQDSNAPRKSRLLSEWKGRATQKATQSMTMSGWTPPYA